MVITGILQSILQKEEDILSIYVLYFGFKLLQHYKSKKSIEDPKLETNNLTPVPLQCLLVKYQVCDGAASWFKGERCGVLNFITG